MKLTDLSPRWIGINRGRLGEVGCGLYCGISFLCPHCKIRRLGVLFKPYIDPENIAIRIQWALPDAPNPNTGEPSTAKFWERTSGDTLETLTLVPSIDCSNFENHWHGSITNGNIT